MGVAEEDELSVANYITTGLLCGLSVNDTMQQPVGLILDLWELYKRHKNIETEGAE